MKPRPNIVISLFSNLFGSKVKHGLIPNKNGHDVEIMEFDDSGRVLVSVDGELPTTLTRDNYEEYIEKKTK